MRVVHVITKGDVGGAQTSVVSLAAAQHLAGDDVWVIAGTDGPAMQAARDHGVGVVVLRELGASRSRPTHVRALTRLTAELTALAPDVVHGHSSSAGLLARLGARRVGAPSVYTAHGWPFQRGANPSQRAASFAGEWIGGRLGDAVICLTDAEAELARRSRVVPSGRLFVVPNGLPDVSGSSLRTSGGAASLRLVMVARFAPPKLQREVVEALARLPGTLAKDWHMTFVGDGPQLEACREITPHRLAGSIDYFGHRDDVPELVAAQDVMILCSRYEGLPVSILEGMRAGLCCVASDLPGVRVLLGLPPAGILVSGAADLEQVLTRLIGDRSEVDRFGAQARRRFESAFSVEAMRKGVDAVYQSVLNARQGGQ